MRRLEDLLDHQAARRPDARAVVASGESLSYGELHEESSRLATVLADRGVRPGSRVCVLLPKTPAALVSILATLKAGGSYVPLDPASPAPRVLKMLESCDDRFLLTSAESADLVSSLLASSPSRMEWCVGWMDRSVPDGVESAGSFTLQEVTAAEPRSARRRSPASAVAYIMFTSGSTGTPKGVTITHENVLSFLDWAVPYFGLGPEDRNSSHTPLHFDLSVFDVFGSIAAGSELHLVPKRLNLMPRLLAQFIRESALTQWFSVPSALNYMMSADCIAVGDFPLLKRMIWCGEVLATPTLRYLMERLPHVEFTNLYGPTEATIASSYHTLSAIPSTDQEDIPIGVACLGEGLLILDESLRSIQAGEVGHLHISGAGLSPGYWRDADKTNAAFLAASVGGETTRVYRTGDLAWMDDDGRFHYVGRADTQIKSRGYRIELGEIEAALRALPCLHDSAVVALASDGFEGWSICCAYVPRADVATDPSAIGTKLRESLPSYMIPQLWLEFDRLPTNTNGKIDRPRLRAEFGALAKVPQ